MGEAGADAGAWENATPSAVSLDPTFNTGAGTNFGTSAFVIDPTNTANVYLGTSAQGIYKSTDCGATWTHINSGMNGSVLDNGRNWTMVIDPIVPSTLYTNSGYGTSGVFKSTNGGTDWAQILPTNIAADFVDNGFIERISLDPTNHLHLIVSPHFTCQGSASSNCILESVDGGQTWSVLANTPASGEASGQMMINQTTWFWAEGYGGLARTTDEGMTWTTVANANGYAWPYLYQDPSGAFYIPAAFNVITSKDGINWTTLSGSPSANVIAGSSTTIYTAQGACTTAATPSIVAPYASAPVSDPTAWQTMQTPSMTYGSGYMSYDEDHHILYSSNCLGGFWRVVTQ